MGWGAGGVADGGGEAVVGDGDRAGRVTAAVAVERARPGRTRWLSARARVATAMGSSSSARMRPPGRDGVDGRHPATWKVSDPP